MGKQQKTEEQYKSEIFGIYSHFRDEPSSDRRQVYFPQLCELVLRWCNGYFIRETYEIDAGYEVSMGYEIFKVLDRMIKNINNIPTSENDFFKYLKTALYNAKSYYFRSFESGLINIPKNKIVDLKKMDDIIRMEECITGKELSENEQVQCVSKWFNMTEKDILEYLHLKNVKYVNGLTNNVNNDNADIDILNFEKTLIPYLEKTFIDPQNEYFAKLNTSENAKRLRDAIESVLNNTQARARECYRALFTVHCIDNAIDFEGLSPLLNSEIVDTHIKNGKKPKLLEVYLKYHPAVKKESAGARASEMSKKFLNTLYNTLKENNPDIFL